MNILEIKNKLFEFFKENDTLVYPDDFLKVVIISENENLDKAIMLSALEIFEKSGLAKKVVYKDGKNEKIAYVLEKPFHACNQNLEISGDLAGLVAKTINNNRDGDDSNLTDPLSINARDIESLLVIIGFLMKAQGKLNIENSDGDDEQF